MEDKTPAKREGDRSTLFGRTPPERLEPLGFRAGWLSQNSVLELIGAQTRRRPEALALADADGELSYAQMMASARAFAGQLQQAGVQREDLVGVFMPRGRNWACAILGIWMVGAVYLPLEVSAPEARTSAILSRSRLKWFAAAPSDASTSAVLADQAQLVAFLEGSPAGALPVADTAISPNSLAYVIFTSGSTGEPKGASVEHGGMLNHLFSKIEDLKITSRDRVAQIAAASFDISVWQVFAALVAGAECHIASDEVAHDPALISAFLRHRAITVAQLVPSLMRAAMASRRGFRGQETDPLGLRLLSLTGEAAPPAVCQDILQRYPQLTLLNAYGPTECSDDVTHYLVDDPRLLDAPTTPIGSAVRNAELYVLSDQGSKWTVTPKGEVGELLVAGPCVGRGYLNDIARTLEAFDTAPGLQGVTRFYRTGDLVRVRQDDLLEFVGRRDRQVKVRGNRVELGDIEAALERCPGVQQAIVVLAAPAANPRQRLAPQEAPSLIAFVAPTDASLDVLALRSAVEQLLPSYMRPDRYLSLREFPLTSNGKVDLKALAFQAGAVDLCRTESS